MPYRINPCITKPYNNDNEQLKTRMKALGLRILEMADDLPARYSAQSLGHQMIRSGTSFGANYSAACRCKSRKDFINKMKIVEEELDETIYWLGMVCDAGFLKEDSLKPLLSESNELMAIVVRSLQTARNNLNKS